MQMLAPRISACGWAVCDCLGRILVALGDVMLTKQLRKHGEKWCWLVFWGAGISDVMRGNEDKWLGLM